CIWPCHSVTIWLSKQVMTPCFFYPPIRRTGGRIVPTFSAKGLVGLLSMLRSTCTTTTLHLSPKHGSGGTLAMMMRAMHTSSHAPALFARGFGLYQAPACCGGSHFLFGSSESSISRRSRSSRKRQHLHSSSSRSRSSSSSSSNSSSNRRTRTTPVLGALMSTRAAGASEDVAALGSRKDGSRPVEGMVRSISPSAVAAFQQCPQLFYYRYILGLKSPPTRETLKGIAVHEVLSLFFTLEEGSRDI
ncbi:unnamed protein product, partial [Ectocarpus sp. 12 AP-2014]